jgi:paraquat-inducible protein B
VTAKPAAVGTFVLGAIALGVVAMLFFGGTQWFAEVSKAAVFFDESVAGLDVGAPVTFRGARIGSVKSVAIRVAPNAVKARIAVILELNPNQVTREGETPVTAPDYKSLVQAGLRAQLAVQSLITGQLRVDLDFRPDTPARLVGTVEGLPEIPAIPSDLGQLRSELTNLHLHELVETGQRTLAAVERLADHVNGELDPLVTSARNTFDSATRTFQSTDSTVHRLQPEISNTLHDFDLLLTDARHQLGARGGELSRTLISADRAARQLDVLLGSLNGLAEPRSEFRGDLEAAIRDLAATASALRGFAHTIERNPNTLLMGRASR